MLNIILILLGKLVLKVSEVSNLGHGSTWPGHVALILNPNFINEITQKNQNLNIILVVGTNGKTTTSKMIKFLLEKQNFKVFQNESGANLLNGIASTLVRHSSFSGKLNYEVAIFEIDENTLPLILNKVTPFAILVLNLFRDQLDRYGEVNTIAKKWEESIKNLNKNTYLFINGDDPQISHIGLNSKLNTYYFGISNKSMDEKEIPHDVDFIYCPVCNNKLTFKKIAYSHLGDYICRKCKFERPKTITFENEKINYPLFGKYNIYNTNAALLLTSTAFNVPVEKSKEYLLDFQPAFGRQEVVKYKNRNFIILLSKNPASFNQSINAILSSSKHLSITTKGVLSNPPLRWNSIDTSGKLSNATQNFNVLLILNDRIPDGRDVSWIWDVDFEELAKASNIVVSGDRVFDMALRLKYTSSSQFQIEENLEKAVKLCLEKTQEENTIYVLPTYSAMLEVRKILGGRSIL